MRPLSSSNGLISPFVYPPAVLYRLENIRKGFGTKDVLVDATWQHDPGRIVGLVGRNGAGKSTVAGA